MFFGICICLLLVMTTSSTAHEDDDDIESKKAELQRARHLRFDGRNQVRPDENVITVDRIRALLRNGFIQLGTSTTTSSTTSSTTKASSTPRRTTTVPIVSTAPNVPRTSTLSKSSSSQEEEEDDADNDKEVTVTSNTARKLPQFEKAQKAATRLNLLVLSAKNASSAFVTDKVSQEEEEEEDDDEEGDGKAPSSGEKEVKASHTRKITSADTSASSASAEVSSEESDHEKPASTRKPSKYLQAQFKRIQSATIQNDSRDSAEATWTQVPVTTSTEPPTTKANFLAQLFRGFDALRSTPPPSPFLPGYETLETKPSSSASAAVPTTTTVPETEATIPLAEKITTTTEQPLPPPQPDYVLASKQLSPFASGVKTVQSEFTKDALDAASQMGSLAWLVNYYETVPQPSRR